MVIIKSMRCRWVAFCGVKSSPNFSFKFYIEELRMEVVFEIIKIILKGIQVRLSLTQS